MCNHYCCDQVDESVTKILPASALAYHCKNALSKDSQCQTIYCNGCTDVMGAQYKRSIPQKERAGVGGGRPSSRNKNVSYTHHSVSCAPTGDSRPKTLTCSYCKSNPPGAPDIVPYNPDKVARSLVGCNLTVSLKGPLLLNENKDYLNRAYCKKAKCVGGEIPTKCLGCKKWLNKNLAKL